jgi:hypothetical protein
MKAAFVRLGIRGFNPKLRNAPERLATLRTPEGSPIPPNTLAELQREMVHLVSSASRSSRSRTPGRNNSKTSHRRDQTPGSWNCNASVVSALRQRTCLCVMCSRAIYGTDGRSPVMRGSQVPLTRVDRDDGKRVSPKRATREYVAACPVGLALSDPLKEQHPGTMVSGVRRCRQEAHDSCSSRFGGLSRPPTSRRALRCARRHDSVDQ